MRDYARIYAKQEYLTPGAAETVEFVAKMVDPKGDAILLDVAAGKGEAACILADRFACRVVAVDLSDPFVQYAASKAWRRKMHDLVTVVRGDGSRLPVGDATCDAAYCIGAVSIVGVESCLAELARAVKPGGGVIVSDVVWREKPRGALGPEWRWVAELEPRLTRDEYADAIEAASLQVETVHMHDRFAWEEYWRPMLRVAQEARTSPPVDVAFADEVESDVDLERRGVAAFWDYATFLARKPDR